jgi:hypothetical protein
VPTIGGLFASPLGGFIQQADFRRQYDGASDGERFLVATTVAGGPTPPISVIPNWKPAREMGDNR